MSDRAWAKLVVGGGPIRYGLLADAIQEEGYELHPQTYPDAVKIRLGALDVKTAEGAYYDGKNIIIEDPEVAGALFDDLEGWLRIKKLAYDRYSSGYVGAWDSCVARFRPGMKYADERVTHETGDEIEMIELADVRNHVRDGDIAEWLEKTYPVIAPCPPIILRP